jgi:hypothetical protein
MRRAACMRAMVAAMLQRMGRPALALRHCEFHSLTC